MKENSDNASSSNARLYNKRIAKLVEFYKGQLSPQANIMENMIAA